MNKVRKAAALKSEGFDDAPIVTATGVRKIADKIIEEAQNNDVPIVENKELADLLMGVDVGNSIPSELYDIVASVVAYIVDIDGDI